MSHFPKLLRKIFFWTIQWIYSKILGVAYGGTPRTIPTTKNSVLMESATSLAGRIRNRKVTSFEVVRSYANRIREVNEVLNCVVDERFEEALAEAKKVDEMIRSGKKTAEELERETPFLGVPFTTAEFVAVEGLSNTMGVWSKRNAKAEADAGVVASMREGGAIPIACTNVSEACFARETNNPVFGRTCNPYDTNRSAGGPFGGEACLVAASGSPLGIAPSPGLPCAFNGVFGHKPSANSCRDTAGLVSRCSADLLPALALLSKDSKIQLKLDEPVDVKRLKYYFVEEDVGSAFASPVSEDIKEVTKRAADHLKNFHKASVERLDLKRSMRAFAACKANVLGPCLREAAINKDDKLNLRKELVKALFGKTRHTYIFLLTCLMEENLRSRKTNDVKQRTEDRAKLCAEFQNLLGSDGVFICPTHPTAAFRHNESPVRGFGFGRSDIFEALGMPATYCPAGLDSAGLPVGFQVVAAANQDRLTLAVAREIDRLFGGWKPPPTHGNFTLKNTVFHNSSDEKIKTL